MSALSVTPVKGLALHHPPEVLLEPGVGVAENRRFYLVDARGRLLAGVRHGPLVRVRAEYDPVDEHLALRFPDGRLVEGRVDPAEPLTTDFYGRSVAGHVVRGHWADALSAYVGRSVRLVRADRPGAACDVHVATLVSRASLAEAGRRAGREAPLDGRRFRMLLEVDGCTPHEEDSWAGRDLRVGEAVLRVPGPVPRCAVTTQDPETGVPDLDTLRVIKGYRGVREGRKIDFGVYADVVRGGRVRLGDVVEPV